MGWDEKICAEWRSSQELTIDGQSLDDIKSKRAEYQRSSWCIQFRDLLKKLQNQVEAPKFADRLYEWEKYLLLALVMICRERGIEFPSVEGPYPEQLERDLNTFRSNYMDGVIPDFDTDLWCELSPQFGSELRGLWVLTRVPGEDND